MTQPTADAAPVVLPPRHTARAAWILLLILAVAAILRLWQLGTLPPGLQFDEAHNALDAVRVLDGARDLFFTDNGGREPLVVYLEAAALAVFGRDAAPFALRLVSALAGLLTILAVYKCIAYVFDDRRLGLFTAAFLAVSYWHLHFSRYGIRAILAPLWATLAVWMWWRAVSPRGGHYPLTHPEGVLGRFRSSAGAGPHPPRHPNAPTAGASGAPPTPSPSRIGGGGATLLVPAALCGLAMAAAVYSHPTGRLIPLILIGHALYRSVVDRGEAKRVWVALGVAGFSAFVVFLPLGWWFWGHPEWFTAHPSDVSITTIATAEFGGSLARALASQAGAILGMFFLAGDPSTFHNLPDLPVFDPLSALFALIGLGIALAALISPDRGRQDRAVLFGLWLVVMLAPTLLSDRPPNYSRAIAALPVIVLLPALGLRWTIAALDVRWSRGAERGLTPRSRNLLAVGVLAFAGMWTVWHYFVVFANRTPHVYYSYDVEKQDAYRELAAMAEDAEVFLHPLWAEHATIAFLNADGPVRSLDPRDTLVLGADGRDAVVALPAKEAEREGWSEAFEDRFGAVATRGEILDAQGEPALVTWRIPASARGDMEPPTDAPLEPEIRTEAHFGGAIDLAGYTIGEARPGEPLPITLVWQAIEPINRNWTTFVHLIGPDGEPLGQMDREPGHASYPTSRWQPGEVIIDHFEPVLAEDAEGPVTVHVGWYDVATGQRMEVGDDTVFRLKPVPVASP